MRIIEGLRRRLLWSCAALAACGGGGNNFPDASSADAVGIDATSQIDAVAAGSVTVTAHSRCCTGAVGALVEGVHVIAMQPDGTVGPTAITDASGVATLTGVQEGATVSAIYELVDGANLITVVGVKPGDHLEFGEKFTPTRAGTGGTLTVTFPDSGAYYYEVATACGNVGVYGPATQATVTLYPSCQTATSDLLLVASDSSYHVIGSKIVRNAPFADGQTVAVTGWDGHLDLVPTLTGLNAQTSYATLRAWIELGQANFSQTIYPGYATGTATGTLALPTGADRIAMSMSNERLGDVGPHVSARGVSGTTTAVTAAANQLPWLGQMVVSVAGTLVQWIPVGTGTYDAAIASVTWSRYDTNTEANVYYAWTVILPPGVSSWSWSNLPAALAAYVPSLDDSVTADMFLVDLTDADGYDGLRAAPEWVSACPECAIQIGDATSADIAYAYQPNAGFAPRAPAGRRGPVAPHLRPIAR